MSMKNFPAKLPSVMDDPLTRRIIACAIEVHKRLGPGLLEKLYKEAMVIELEIAGMKVEKNVQIQVEYRSNTGRIQG